MKKSIFILIGGVILFLLIVFISYFSYKFFNNKGVSISTVEIVVDDNGNKVDMKEQVPIEDDEKDSITPYKFSVRNTGEEDIYYQLLIEDYIDEKDITRKMLSKKNLRYELKLNGQVVEIDNLSNIKNNILDIRTLGANRENNYELRLWVTGNLESSEWMDKYYSYNISINPISK